MVGQALSGTFNKIGDYMAYGKTRCFSCSGEVDADGWCANYCADCDNEVNCHICRDQGLRDCPECSGIYKDDHDDPCSYCNGYGKVRCTHQIDTYYPA